MASRFDRIQCRREGLFSRCLLAKLVVTLDIFLRVILKVHGLVLLLRLPWPRFQFLELQSERDPLCILHSVGPGRTAQEWLWVAPRPSLIISPPFGGPYACRSSCPWGSRGCGCNPSGIGFLGLQDGIAICAFRISFVSILQEGVRTFCPSTGQDPAGVGNAGPNPRHQTWALGWQTGPVFSDPRIQPLLHELFRPVRILCIFFMNT